MPRHRATEVDHIDPHGPDDERNYQSLCKSAHSSKTAREVNARRWARARAV